jgi:hypothetical protein
VVVQGKQYKSIHAYKREQIKETLKRALSSYDLLEFDEDELEEIVREIRKHQAVELPLEEEGDTVGSAGPSSLRTRPKVMEEDDSGTIADQMREMLDEYRGDHKGAADLQVDPRKVKSVIIGP